VALGVVVFKMIFFVLLAVPEFAYFLKNYAARKSCHLA
jgi:hypothetical protein